MGGAVHGSNRSVAAVTARARAPLDDGADRVIFAHGESVDVDNLVAEGDARQARRPTHLDHNVLVVEL